MAKSIKTDSKKVAKAAEIAPSLSGGLEKVNREFQEKAALKEAHTLGVPYVNIGSTPLNPDLLKLVDLADAKAGRIIPFFKVGKKLRVAIDDGNRPETKAVIEKLAAAGFKVSLNLASSDGINEAIDSYEQAKQFSKPKIVKKVNEGALETFDKEIAVLSDLPKKIEGVTAEEGLNLLNIGAMKTGASDVHYEPQEGIVTVRFRIDGILHKVFEISVKAFANIVNQIKYEAKMQLNVTTAPQDGRYLFNYNDQKVAVRVSSLPTPYGESLVCRFLSSGNKILTFEDLGFQGDALAKLQKSCDIAHGMILCTGPTGSGKSTTLYSILSKMNKPENKIITLEDPVEYYVKGITQSQIDDKHQYNFATGLKAVLRQDPDVVMLGEIRDLQTAQTAAQASLTGHVLLSTLHTNSAIETIPRLINMGMVPFTVAPALNTIIAQRLVRKVCPSCSTKAPISDSEKREFEEVYASLKKVSPDACGEVPSEVPKVEGCEKCSNTGYKGRVVISEVITLTPEMKDLILNNASSDELFAQARKEGMLTIREDGHIKVAAGLTTLEEVHRVTTVSV